MNAHLAEIARPSPGRAGRAGARRRRLARGHALVVPDNITLLHLPPYSPELNPVENVWEYLRANWLAISVFDDYDAIVEAAAKLEPLRG